MNSQDRDSVIASVGSLVKTLRKPSPNVHFKLLNTFTSLSVVYSKTFFAFVEWKIQ